MARGVEAAGWRAVLAPIADGGEGTVDALATRRQVTRVTGPRGGPIDAAWGWIDPSTAVVELAAAAGLCLVPPGQRDPTTTTTFGVGELLQAALDAGAQRIVLGIGGSATNDGGCGLAQAMGVRFFGADHQPLRSPITASDLIRIHRIEHPLSLPIDVACDVTNPLTGPRGAAAVYSPQKGASPEQVRMLDAGLRHLATLWREQCGVDVEELPGSGAAGGVGGGVVAMLGATLRRGVELVLDAVHFHDKLRGCDLCLTGEGRLDSQSGSGKAVQGVVHAAQQAGVPVVALVGRLDADPASLGLHGAVEIGQGLSHDESLRRAEELLTAAAYRVVRHWRTTP